jgi:exopolysaccharide biosynthesis protein
MMNKLLLTILFSMFYTLKSMGQSAPDSSAFAHASWKMTAIGKHILWQQYHFNDKQLFNSNQNINVVRVKNKGRKIQKKFVSAGDNLVLTSVLAKQAEAQVAINGSFFNVKEGGAVDLIKIGGKVLHTTFLTKGKRSFHQNSAIAFHKNRLKILRGDTLDVKWDEKLDYKDVMVTGPLLLWKGENAPLPKIAFNDNRHPRTCACVTKKNELILLTVDGRTAESQGVSLPELTVLMRWLNCQDAINLDGGGSTTMYIGGAGVVNMPCDNKKFDHEGERKVSNILILKGL